jgi:cytochrome c oxidase cbb3-type subunit 3
MSEHKKVHMVGDGILEEDNHLPNWWLATFYGTILFAFFYWQYFHVFEAGALPPQEYAAIKKVEAAKVAAVKAATPTLTNDQLMAMSRGAEAQEGATLFATNCLACHGALGEGKIGPNLTDKFWIHGGQPTEIMASVTNGYALKGMPAWGPVLGGDKVGKVVSFVLTLRDKNAPGGKAPEGLEFGTAAPAPTDPAPAPGTPAPAAPADPAKP